MLYYRCDLCVGGGDMYIMNTLFDRVHGVLDFVLFYYRLR